jgi:hypothetical protein
MDDLKLLIDGILSGGSRKSVNYIEKVLVETINDGLRKYNLNSQIINTNNKKQIHILNGFPGYDGETLIELRLYQYINGFYKFTEKELLEGGTTRIADLISNNPGVENIIIVVNIELEQTSTTLKNRIHELKVKFDRVNLHFIELDNLNEFLEGKIDVIRNAIENVDEQIVKSVIEAAIIQGEDWQSKNKLSIESLSRKLKEEELVLFLGAGASTDAGVPLWNDLITDMFVNLLDRIMNERGTILSEEEKNEIIKYFKKSNSGAPTLQSMYLKTGLQTSFREILSEVLYKKSKESSILLDEIVKLCTPPRNGKGLFAIVSYNFDDLVEQKLEENEIGFRSIYRDNNQEKGELPIYHVHGYLPRNKEKYNINEKDPIVFTEDEYHQLDYDHYHWSNLIQLNLLKQKTCLFIGMSLTDPNLRRLLDYSKSKDEDSNKKHYAILKRDVIYKKKKGVKKKHIVDFENSNQSIMEDYFKEIDVQVIWVNKFEDIPELLRKIRRNSMVG